LLGTVLFLEVLLCLAVAATLLLPGLAERLDARRHAVGLGLFGIALVALPLLAVALAS
jgi:hypothetical protein